jgi:hypothetical protein
MQFFIKASAIVLASVFTVTTAIVPTAEASPTSTSEQIIARAEQRSSSSRKRVRRNKRQPRRSTRPTQRNQQSGVASNQAFQTGLGVVAACGYSRRSNTSACSTLDSSISILSEGCAKGDRNACQWVRELYDLEAAATASTYIQSF